MSFRAAGLLLCGGLMASMLAEGARAEEKKTPEATGACVYSAINKAFCAVVSQANCATLKGAWTSGAKCH
jgi:hypothetical protein